MDDAVFNSNIALGAPSDSAMELDYMDELLLEGCWLETTDGSNFFPQNPSTFGAFFDSAYPWPMLEATHEKTSISPSQKNSQEERETIDLAENSVVIDPQQSLVSLANGLSQSDKFFGDGSELNRVLWIAPRLSPAASSVVERFIKALNYIKNSARSKDTLIQIWVPVNRGGTWVLSTTDQPFSINSTRPKLADYRNISMNYEFAAQENSSESVGLPGRVFLGKVPEWTPDVRFFGVDEYPRVPYAEQCDVRGTLALPVFEQGSRNCLGVIEVVMTTSKINYRPELDSVCRALEAVDLRCTEFAMPQKAKECNSSYQAALPEILEVLKSACGSHGLPLAQTWVPCIQQGKQGCRHSDENLPNCISTVDSAGFIADPSMREFHEACSEHHLFKGQGVAGKAFLTNQPCFSPDITTYSKTEYPLSHHARMFGLCAAVAIRLRSIYTGNADFVLEFFLPTGCRDPEEQKKMLSSLSFIIQRVCRSLRIVTDKELEQEALVSDKIVTVISDDSLHREKVLTVKNTGSGSCSQEDSCRTAVQVRSSIPSLQQEAKPREALGGKLLKQHHPQGSNLNGSQACGGEHATVADRSCLNSGKSGEKKRAKAEKTITLDVLRQHFAGSLKDAAKSIGVCPTTLKRICRQHGIKRWPSRKIKKVGHSLQKLQVVIDSVQGASGAFQIGSFYSNFPDLASPNFSGTSTFSTSKQCEPSQQPNQEHGGAPGSPRTATSKSPSSSCSQTSSSSQCWSSGTQQQPLTWNSSGNGDSLKGVSSHGSGLKRARSEAELHAPSQDATKLISRSHSQKSLFEQLNVDKCPPLPRNIGQVIQEGDSWRVKIMYGEEKIRFRMLKSWGFKDLVQEVVRRFSIGDMSGFHLKYLDDDSEWVLLTCDDDLEECVDICQSSQRQTIKLSLQMSHSHSRCSIGSNSQS